MTDPEDGHCSPELGNCGSPAAVPYFISFQVLGGFIFLNLVVAVIIDTFSSLSDVNPELATRDDIELFKEAWARFDPDAKNYLHIQDLPKLLLELPPPLGMKGTPGASMTKAATACLKLELSHYRGGLTFGETLHTLVKRSFAAKDVDVEAMHPLLLKAQKEHADARQTRGSMQNLQKHLPKGQIGNEDPPVLDPNRSYVADTFALLTFMKYAKKLRRWAHDVRERLQDTDTAEATVLPSRSAAPPAPPAVKQFLQQQSHRLPAPAGGHGGFGWAKTERGAASVGSACNLHGICATYRTTARRVGNSIFGRKRTANEHDVRMGHKSMSDSDLSA